MPSLRPHHPTLHAPPTDEGGRAAGHGQPPTVHGSESFFILGEGLLGETAGGRRAAAADEPRRAAAGPENPPFRFWRMGPKGKLVPEGLLRKLAVAMTRAGGGDTGIAAGYTYLGQFVDHDLTMDKTDVMFRASISPGDMLQGRSPSLDLDSLYGGGPQDTASEKFYADDGLRLKLGKADDGGPFDLPRKGGRTLIPDHRNDENLAVAQMHLAFIRFHNRIVKELADVPEAKRFATLVTSRTPLWFYVLREAELNGGKLAGVGARIVAETFHRAIEGSKASIIRDEDFTPGSRGAGRASRWRTCCSSPSTARRSCSTRRAAERAARETV